MVLHQFSSREVWLEACIEVVRPLFAAQGAVIPDKLRISCGFPSGRAVSAKNRAIGECWEAQASADDSVQVFISPVISDSFEVAELVVHELIHSIAGPGHRGKFKRLAVAVGLVGSMRATVAGEVLRQQLQILIAPLGPYPHAAIDPAALSHKKQSTRLLKAECPEPGCLCKSTRKEPYSVRITRICISYGLPVCPCCGAQMIEITEVSTT